MFVTIFLLAAFALTSLVVFVFMRGLDLEPGEEQAAKVLVTEERPKEGHCLLCGSPIARAGASSDDVVLEIERRIGAETSVVIQALAQPGRDSLTRLYLS